MNSRVSWSVDGIDPSVRERAEAAARRAGMSLSDWLNSTIGESAPPGFPQFPRAAPAMPSQESRDVADIHQRLDSITRQIEQISKPRAAQRRTARRSPRGEPSVARQLNDAISRLDARLSQISNPAPARQAQMQDRQRQSEMVERAAAEVYRPSPPLSPTSFDSAIAEIAARQNELDGGPHTRRADRTRCRSRRRAQRRLRRPLRRLQPIRRRRWRRRRRSGFLRAGTASGQDHEPDRGAAAARPIEQSIAAFRSELAEIRHAITEAMPRRAIESIENEIRSLSRRIDDTRQNGSDSQALADIEHALGEIHEVLRSLTPAEQLAGYDEAIRKLHAKLDLILRANDDPSTVHQLEGAIAALRSIVSNVASNDALARLSDDVHTLSAKVDQLARSAGHGDALGHARAAHRRTDLDNRKPRAAAGRVSDNSEYIESAIRSLSERIDRMPVGNDNASAFAHLEQRVSYLLERIEASDRPARHAGNLGRVEEGAAGHPAPSRRTSTPIFPPSRITAGSRLRRRRRWTPNWSTSSSASCPTSAKASRKPTAAPRMRWRRCTRRSAMSSIASR